MKQGKAVSEQYRDGRVADRQSRGCDPQARWPAGGTRLAPGVQPPGFLPVTEEILAEIVRLSNAYMTGEVVHVDGSGRFV